MRRFWIAQIKKDLLWNWSYKISFFTQFVGILITIYIFYFVSETFSNSLNEHLREFGNNYFLFVIIGIGMVDLISMLMSSSVKSLRDAQTLGYIDIVLNARISLQYFLICSMLYPFLLGVVKLICYLGIAFLLKKYDLSVEVILVVFFISVLTLSPFVGLALMSSAFVLVYKQGQPINTAVGMLLFLFSGVVFPVSVLPDYLQTISYMIPATFGIEYIRKVLIFNDLSVVSHESIFILFMASLVSCILGYIAIEKAVRKVKINGTSGNY